MTECPTPAKSRYSEAGAAYALERHREAFPACAGVHAYPCPGGQHHHIGHETHASSRACRRTVSTHALEALAARFAK